MKDFFFPESLGQKRRSALYTAKYGNESVHYVDATFGSILSILHMHFRMPDTALSVWNKGNEMPSIFLGDSRSSGGMRVITRTFRSHVPATDDVALLWPEPAVPSDTWCSFVFVCYCCLIHLTFLPGSWGPQLSLPGNLVPASHWQDGGKTL